MKFCTECKFAKIVDMGDVGNKVYCTRCKDFENRSLHPSINRKHSPHLNFKKLSAPACFNFEGK